jgi:hypothetical protein
MAAHYILANLITFYIFLFDICFENFPNQVSSSHFENFNHHYVQLSLAKFYPKLGNATD